MRYTKWILILISVILLSMSQNTGVYESLIYYIRPEREPSLFFTVFYSLISGLFIFINKLIDFLLSWEGVLLVGILGFLVTSKNSDKKE